VVSSLRCSVVCCFGLYGLLRLFLGYCFVCFLVCVITLCLGALFVWHCGFVAGIVWLYFAMVVVFVLGVSTSDVCGCWMLVLCFCAWLLGVLR